MGLGKTAQVLISIKQFPERGPVVVVCPASLKENWEAEAARVGIRATVLEGTRPTARTRALLGRRRGFYIINYDVLFKRRKTPGRKAAPGWLQELLQLDPWMVVTDEGHYLKSRTSKRSKAVKTLTQASPHYIDVTGTPLTSRPAELWPALNMLWPEEFPAFMEFAMKHCGPRKRFWGWEFKGASRLDELHEQLRALGMIRRLKADVLKDLPPKRRFVVPVELHDPDGEYREAERQFIRWMRKNFGKRKADKAAKAQQMVQMGYLARLAGRLKRPAVEEWINTFQENTNGKLIVFGVHKKVVRGLHRVYHHQAVLVDGSVPSGERQQAFRGFARNRSIKLFFGNIQAAGTGWNGTAASTVVFAEMGWTPGEHTQCEDRINRIGQTEPADIYYLVARGTIEEDRIKTLEKKSKVVGGVLDANQSEFSYSTTPVWDETAKRMLQRYGG